MNPNIGIINAMLRITAGLSMLTCITISARKSQGQSFHTIMVLMASMKVAEGIVRYCPLTAVYNEMATEKDGKEEGWQQNFTKS